MCRQWEAAADPARAAGVSVSHLRTGLVLTRDGGVLKRLTPIAKLGAAGKLGSGRQYWPWISLADEIGAIRFLLENDVPGPVNLTGPAPVRNSEFMAALGRIVHRPTVLPTPAFAIKIALGQFAEDVLTGPERGPRGVDRRGVPVPAPRRRSRRCAGLWRAEAQPIGNPAVGAYIATFKFPFFGAFATGNTGYARPPANTDVEM